MFGKPNDEAKDLIILLQTLKRFNFIYFELKVHPQNKNLEVIVFANLEMVNLYKKFKDIAILETTFG